MTRSIADIRTEYMGEPLDVVSAESEPLRQFESWFDAALRAEVPDANAMTLATVDAEGAPAARIVLLKGIDPRGFLFFTNYASDKGAELEAAARAALVFFWQPLARQVRVRGVVERLPEDESDAYFASRPRESQIGAWASPQSRVVSGRAELERNAEAARARFPDAVPRPPNWGGYVVRPERVEFWQGRPGRLHDRLSYRLGPDGTWSVVRLAP